VAGGRQAGGVGRVLQLQVFNSFPHAIFKHDAGGLARSACIHAVQPPSHTPHIRSQLAAADGHAHHCLQVAVPGLDA